jgi:3',5'-cyclic AMP phosphodiesterase CpdA
MLIAQITDTHILEPGILAFGRIDTAERLRACVARVNGLDPPVDAVMMTGDLTDNGTPAECRNLRDIIGALRAPVYMIPGNHDRRDNLRAAFGYKGYFPPGSGFLHYTIEEFPVRIIAADTVIEGEAGGIMDRPRLEWLEARLAEDQKRPTILAMHHPPFATGIVHMDGMNCAGADELASVVSRHPNVERIICGHVHRAIQHRFAGTIAMISPSTAFQVALDFDPAAPARWTDEPPGFMLHHWSGNGGLSSHVCYVADPGPKRPFH